ncbi:MAG: flagellar biosynthesis anti-sigma factor FlgM [bacterium]
MEAEPEVRADKVAEIKARIKSGEYQVDTQALARNLLKEGLQESTS